MTALDTFPHEVTIWRRYVDDTISALDNALLDPLTTHINSIDDAIKFTREDESNRSMPMLDACAKRDHEGKLSFSVYRKPTHTDQNLQFTSNQPLQHKLGVIRTLHHRCQTLCSTEESKVAELEHLRKFSVCQVIPSQHGTWPPQVRRPLALNRPTDNKIPQPSKATSPSLTLLLSQMPSRETFEKLGLQST